MPTFAQPIPRSHTKARCAVEKRIQWLAMLCNLPPRAIQVLRRLSLRDDWTPLGQLVDGLGAAPFEMAQLRAPLLEWGLVRFRNDPEASLRLNRRIWNFLHEEAAVRICDLEPAQIAAKER